jgi:hypothetical protein
MRVKIIGLLECFVFKGMIALVVIFHCNDIKDDRYVLQ